MAIHLYIVICKRTDAIESYIQATHYKEKSFEIEMFFNPMSWLLKKDKLLHYRVIQGLQKGLICIWISR
jgi:hypothetical protein